MPESAKRLLFAAMFAPTLCAQTLSVAPSATDRNNPGSFSLTLHSPTGKAPVAMQWEFSIPAAISVKQADITVGTAAKAAGKSVICASKPGTNGGTRYACILAGGQSAIANGTIAVVQYRSQEDVHGAPIRVGIENVMGVSADLKRISIPNATSIITIR